MKRLHKLEEVQSAPGVSCVTARDQLKGKPFSKKTSSTMSQVNLHHAHVAHVAGIHVHKAQRHSNHFLNLRGFRRHP